MSTLVMLEHFICWLELSLNIIRHYHENPDWNRKFWAQIRTSVVRFHLKFTKNPSFTHLFEFEFQKLQSIQKWDSISTFEPFGINLICLFLDNFYSLTWLKISSSERFPSGSVHFKSETTSLVMQMKMSECQLQNLRWPSALRDQHLNPRMEF